MVHLDVAIKILVGNRSRKKEIRKRSRAERRKGAEKRRRGDERKEMREKSGSGPRELFSGTDMGRALYWLN
jgi:hypothetical protein